MARMTDAQLTHWACSRFITSRVTG